MNAVIEVLRYVHFTLDTSDAHSYFYKRLLLTRSDSCVLVPRPFPVATVTFYPPPKGLFDEPIEIVFSRQSSLVSTFKYVT